MEVTGKGGDQRNGDEGEEQRSEVFKEYAMAIGFLCIEWAQLELPVDRLLRIIMGWSHCSDVTHAIAANIDMHSKLKIVQAVGFIIRPSTASEWFNDLQRICNAIENESRPLRNRFVHDVWMGGGSEESFTRRQRTTKFFRPQSFQPGQLGIFRNTPTPIADAWGLVRSIIDASKKLNELANIYYQFRERLST